MAISATECSTGRSRRAGSSSDRGSVAHQEFQAAGSSEAFIHEADRVHRGLVGTRGGLFTFCLPTRKARRGRTMDRPRSALQTRRWPAGCGSGRRGRNSTLRHRARRRWNSGRGRRAQGPGSPWWGSAESGAGDRAGSVGTDLRVGEDPRRLPARPVGWQPQRRRVDAHDHHGRAQVVLVRALRERGHEAPFVHVHGQDRGACVVDSGVRRARACRSAAARSPARGRQRVSPPPRSGSRPRLLPPHRSGLLQVTPSMPERACSTTASTACGRGPGPEPDLCLLRDLQRPATIKALASSASATPRHSPQQLCVGVEDE